MLESNVTHVVAVKFGLFEVNLTRSILSRQGVRIKLQEQPFRILALLLQHNGEIVKREELRSLKPSPAKVTAFWRLCT